MEKDEDGYKCVYQDWEKVEEEGEERVSLILCALAC